MAIQEPDEIGYVSGVLMYKMLEGPHLNVPRVGESFDLPDPGFGGWRAEVYDVLWTDYFDSVTVFMRFEGWEMGEDEIDEAVAEGWTHGRRVPMSHLP